MFILVHAKLHIYYSGNASFFDKYFVHFESMTVMIRMQEQAMSFKSTRNELILAVTRFEFTSTAIDNATNCQDLFIYGSEDTKAHANTLMLTIDAPNFDIGLHAIGHNANGMPVTIMTTHANSYSSKHAILRTARPKCTGITMTSWNSRLVTLNEAHNISYNTYDINDINDAAHVTMLLTRCETGDASR